MKQIIYNAQTKETTIVDVLDVEMPVILSEPTLDERVTTLEPRVTTVEDVVLELLLMP